MILFIFSVMFLNPEIFSPIKGWIDNNLNTLIVELLNDYYEPLMQLLINFCIIPLAIDLCCEFEDFRRKSSKQISIMRRIYIFMFINTFLIPMTQSSMSKDVFQKFFTNEVIDWPKIISFNLMN